MVSIKKIEDLAFSLPLFGIILIAPPIINVFSVDRTIFGIPFFVIYIFTVWITLIFLTWRLSTKLPATDHKNDDPTQNLHMGEHTNHNVAPPE